MKLKFKDLEIDTRNTFISTIIIVSLVYLLTLAIITAGDIASEYFKEPVPAEGVEFEEN